MIQQSLDFTPKTYRTEHFTPEQREKSEKSAGSQEARILRLYKETGRAFTASDIFLHFERIDKPLGINITLLTSIRRALSTLTRRGHLRKTTDTKEGMHRKNEFYYEVNDERY